MNDVKSIKENYIYNTVFQVLLLLLPFITTPYISRVLGADNIGIYSYSTSMVTYFSLLGILGSNTYGQRKIAYSRDDKKELSQDFWNIISFRVIMSVLAIILYIIYLITFGIMNTINLLVGLTIVNNVLDISWFFQGIEDFKSIVYRNLIIKILLLIGIFVFIKTENDLFKYVLVIIASQILGSLSMWKIIPRYVDNVKQVYPFSGFKQIWQIFLPSISVQIYTVLDKSMIGWITASNYSNGCYEQSEKIARLAITVVTSIGMVILPRVANLYNKNKLDEAKRYVYLAFRVVWMISLPLMFGLIATAQIFIPLFLGPGFDQAIPLLKIFSFLIVFVSLAYVVGMAYLIPTGQQNIYTIAVTVGALGNFFVNLFLIPRIGAIGAAIGSIIAELIGMLIQIIYCIRTKQLKFKLIISESWKYGLASLIMFLIVTIIKTIFGSGLSGLIIMVISGMFIYILILYLLNDKIIKSILKKKIYN